MRIWHTSLKSSAISASFSENLSRASSAVSASVESTKYLVFLTLLCPISLLSLIMRLYKSMRDATWDSFPVFLSSILSRNDLFDTRLLWIRNWNEKSSDTLHMSRSKRSLISSLVTFFMSSYDESSILYALEYENIPVFMMPPS